MGVSRNVFPLTVGDDMVTIVVTVVFKLTLWRWAQQSVSESCIVMWTPDPVRKAFTRSRSLHSFLFAPIACSSSLARGRTKPCDFFFIPVQS